AQCGPHREPRVRRVGVAHRRVGGAQERLGVDVGVDACAGVALCRAGQREIAEVAVVAASMDICPPCGGCRQRLSEFATARTPVHLGRPGGARRTIALGELLPLGFDADALPA
ncbi:MAG: cytidine deaminase, partial [Solirubrobacteraceae bacterium]|nr:cytidine deaminase [Solirubrobacteraceae bacterium]